MKWARTSPNCRLWLATLLAGGLAALAVQDTMAEESAWSWNAAARETRGFLDKGEVPISFTYGGRSSRELLPTWTVTRNSTEERDRRLHTVTYADPVSGLELAVKIRQYKDFPAVEWVLHFKNTSAVDTPILEDVQALDITLDIEPPQGEVILHRALGCTSTVSDFAPVDEILPPGVKSKVCPVGGRSSNAHMPFFNLELPGNRGAVVAIGWTGQWVAEFERRYRGDGRWVTVRTGMERTHLKLHPGEAIRTPQSFLMFWEGDRIAGYNQFRRLVLRHKTPQMGGKPAELPIAGCSWFQFGSGNGYTETNQIAFAQLYKKLGLDFETFWVDAGWFEGGWPHGVGNWFPKKDAFPNGFGNLSQTVHDLGMKFLVWFEPERVAAGSWLQREHPEWLLSHAEGAKIYCPDASVRNYLLNLGNPAARAWLTDHVSQMITEARIDIYRHDANIDPQDFWPLADAPDRQGITQIRHVEGLYSYWEDLKARHPGLLVECCCSGNRRFDLESISRTINLWRSDYVFHPSGDQCQTYGISFFVQLHANGCNTVDKYGFRSMLAPGMCLCWDPRAPDFPLDQAREDIALFKRVRPYLAGDYYPLTPYSTKENVWLAYQFHRPDLDEGVIFAFKRPSCPSLELALLPGGMRPDAQYEVENIDTGKKELHQGSALASGWRVRVEQKPGSAVLIYRQVK